jgi:hypothetical protein
MGCTGRLQQETVWQVAGPSGGSAPNYWQIHCKFADRTKKSKMGFASPLRTGSVCS